MFRLEYSLKDFTGLSQAEAHEQAKESRYDFAEQMNVEAVQRAQDAIHEQSVIEKQARRGNRAAKEILKQKALKKELSQKENWSKQGVQGFGGPGSKLSIGGPLPNIESGKPFISYDF